MQGIEVTVITIACHRCRRVSQLVIPVRCETCGGEAKVQGVWIMATVIT